MKLINNAKELEVDRNYLCGKFEKWEIWTILQYDDQEEILYCKDDIMSEYKKFDDFVYVFELPKISN